MIVVDVLGIGRAADRAHAALLRQELVELSLAHAVALSKVILPGTAVEACLDSRPRAL
jgi:hypothetical protein